jgi:8-oxo-dGTP pyrophosphatase MutT (NUDIX family)
VRLRKRNEWVLPKGKLDDGETPRAAAMREVLEETGHDVSIHLERWPMRPGAIRKSCISGEWKPRASQPAT